MLVIGFEMRSGEAARPVLTAGALAVIVGIATFLWPGLTELALLVLVALRAVIVGVAELVIAARIGRHASGVRLLSGIGLLSIAFGGLLLVCPRSAILAVAWAIVVDAIVVGLVGIARGWLVATTRFE